MGDVVERAVMSVLRGRRYYTVAEFALRTGLDPATVTKRCQRGYYRLKPNRKTGQRYQIVAAELRRELGTNGRG